MDDAMQALPYQPMVHFMGLKLAGALDKLPWIICQCQLDIRVPICDKVFIWQIICR